MSQQPSHQSGLKFVSRGGLKRLSFVPVVLLTALILIWTAMLWMPGDGYRGSLSMLSPMALELRSQLETDITMLSETIGRRNIGYLDALNQAEAYIYQEFQTAGYEPDHQHYQAQGQQFGNVIAEIKGTQTPEEIIVIGAHYDTAFISDGANDNGTGVAATLAIARHFAHKFGRQSPAKTIRFVAFTNEEPPFFQTEAMGSWVYAQSCRQNQDKIVAMLSLETMGYYSDEVDSQKYPFPLNLVYPNQGNFIGFIGNLPSRRLVHQVIGLFRQQVQFPSEGAALPAGIPGVGWSDHWAFWKAGYPAMMVTDTAPYRYPHYHTLEDTADKVDYDRLARVVRGLEGVIEEMAG